MKLIALIMLVIIVSIGSNSICAQKKFEAGGTIVFQTPKFVNGSIAYLNSSNDFRVRPAFSGFVKYYMGKHLFAEYGLSYSFEGGGFKQRKTNLDFIRNEILLGYTTSLEKRNSFNLKLGYSYCFLTNASLIYKHEGTKEDIKEFIKPYYNSFPIVLGYKRKMKNDIFLSVNIGVQIIRKTLGANGPLYFGQSLAPKLGFGISKFIK